MNTFTSDPVDPRAPNGQGSVLRLYAMAGFKFLLAFYALLFVAVTIRHFLPVPTGTEPRYRTELISMEMGNGIVLAIYFALLHVLALRVIPSPRRGRDLAQHPWYSVWCAVVCLPLYVALTVVVGSAVPSTLVLALLVPITVSLIAVWLVRRGFEVRYP